MSQRVGVIGWPVKHSRSPVIFGHWFDRYGIDARYDLIPVEPETLSEFFATFRAQGLTGCNITVPHKVEAAKCIDVLDPIGQRCGAINTVWIEGEMLHATSSDGLGFLAGLDQGAPTWRGGRRATVIGAGGAAVSVCDALITAGMTVSIVNRSPERAQALADQLGADANGFEALPHLLPATDLLVNTTSLGMQGQPPLTVDLTPLPATAVVTDIVYTPLITDLLAAAQQRGLATVDGLGMLLHQATVGFERWFGIAPEVNSALRDKVLATL